MPGAGVAFVVVDAETGDDVTRVLLAREGCAA